MSGSGRSERPWRYWPRLLLAIPFALVAWVPFYNRIEPTLLGIPFFYWYQLSAILLGAAIVVAVYLIEKRGARNSGQQGRSGDDDDTTESRS